MPFQVDLKDRELDILRLLAEGLSDRAIGARLNLSSETVRWYNKQVYGKLGVTSRGEAARRATALGLIGEREAPLGRPPVKRSPIRYANNDGIAVAYQVVGNGPVDLLFIPASCRISKSPGRSRGMQSSSTSWDATRV